MKFQAIIVNRDGNDVIQMEWSWKEFWVRSCVPLSSPLLPMIHHARMLKRRLRDKLGEQTKGQHRQVRGKRAFAKFR